MNRQRALQAAYQEAKRVLGGIIEDRRQHPYKWYLFHAIMATSARLERRSVAAWWHRQWRRRYWALAQATEQAGLCLRHMDDEEGGAV